MLTSQQLATALAEVSLRQAEEWLSGDRPIGVVELGRVLEAFPDVDARALVMELAIRRVVQESQFGLRQEPEDESGLRRSA